MIEPGQLKDYQDQARPTGAHLEPAEQLFPTETPRSQATCPGNSSGTTTVSLRSAAVPHTPRPTAIRHRQPCLERARAPVRLLGGNRSHPIQIGQHLIEKRRHVRRVGQAIALAGKQSGQLLLKISVGVRL